jgi:hypothetical protein
LHFIDSSKIRENALRLHSSRKVVDRYMSIFNKECRLSNVEVTTKSWNYL